MREVSLESMMEHHPDRLPACDIFGRLLSDDGGPTWSAYEYERLSDALRSLSNKQFEVLMLLYWGQLSERDAAEKMSISRRSVRVHHRRAIKKLREMLNDSSE